MAPRKSILCTSMVEKKSILCNSMVQRKCILCNSMVQRKSSLCNSMVQRKCILCNSMVQRKSTLCNSMVQRKSTLCNSMVQREKEAQVMCYPVTLLSWPSINTRLTLRTSLSIWASQTIWTRKTLRKESERERKMQRGGVREMQRLKQRREAEEERHIEIFELVIISRFINTIMSLIIQNANNKKRMNSFAQLSVKCFSNPSLSLWHCTITGSSPFQNLGQRFLLAACMRESTAETDSISQKGNFALKAGFFPPLFNL